MKPFAVIPIRSGSKGLQNKNMLYFGNKPLVCSTIDALIDSKIVDDIYVSTDSQFYIDILKNMYPNILFDLRDERLASDDSSTSDFLSVFLKKFDKGRDFILCQATSPLRNGEQIKEATDGELENVRSGIDKLEQAGGISDIGKDAADAGRQKLEGSAEEYEGIISETDGVVNDTKQQIESLKNNLSGIFG